MAKILIHGSIGGHWLDDVSSRDVIKELDAVADGEDVHVHINSPGGDVFHGVAIYQQLKNHDGRIIVHVDALAASAASVVAMAGDEIIMGDAAMLMIHNPWSLTVGDAGDHRKTAETLDSIREGMLNAYRFQTGKGKEELRALLDDTTWYDAESAVEQGFATSVDGETDEEDIAALANFDLSKLNDMPQRLRARVAAAVPSRQTAAPIMAMADDKGASVLNGQKKTNNSNPQPNDSAAADNQQAIDAAREEARQETVEEMNARMDEIRAACKKAELGDGFAFDLIKEGVSADEARRRILDKLAEDTPAPTTNANPSASSSGIGMIAGPHENFRNGAIQSIMARAGFESHDPKNAYSSYTLMDLCRAAAIQAGISDRGKTRMALIGEVFAAAGHTTSDFAYILDNSIRKSLLAGWEEAAETYQQWTKKGSLPDFKIAERNQLGLVGEFPEIPEGGAYEQGTLSDTGEIIQLATFGKMIVLSRKAIINDDLNLFAETAKKMGDAAARTVGSLAYLSLTGNPKLKADNTEVFHANHNNTAANATLAMDTISEGITAMATQRDPDNKATALNLEPKFLLVPHALRKKAQKLMSQERNPDDLDEDNTVAGSAEVIADGRLDLDNPKRWYLVADPNRSNGVEVAFLDGIDTPELEQQRGWTVDGMQYKARIDAASKPLGFRGLYRGTGA